MNTPWSQGPANSLGGAVIVHWMNMYSTPQRQLDTRTRAAG